MFSVPLELPEFEVIKQDFHSNSYVIHVEKKCSEERCPYCGFMTSFVHDRRTRKVRDLMIFNKPLFLMVHSKRYRCLNCFEVFSQSFDSIQPNKHQTNRYREYLFELCRGTTIQDVSQKQGIPYTTLERIYYSVAQEKAIEHKKFIVDCMDQDDLVLSLDEVSVRKGHRYETVLLDAKLGCVIGMDKDRSFQSTIDLLSRNVLSPESVQTIVMDMWDPFHKAVGNLFPHACIVIDKYHVVQKVTQALDQVRKQFPSLKKKRFILLKNFEKLNDEEKDQLGQLLEEHLELSYAYYLKELF